MMFAVKLTRTERVLEYQVCILVKTRRFCVNLLVQFKFSGSDQVQTGYGFILREKCATANFYDCLEQRRYHSQF